MYWVHWHHFDLDGYEHKTSNVLTASRPLNQVKIMISMVGKVSEFFVNMCFSNTRNIPQHKLTISIPTTCSVLSDLKELRTMPFMLHKVICNQFEHTDNIVTKKIRYNNKEFHNFFVQHRDEATHKFLFFTWVIKICK
jgi:hypothetical protein